MDREAKKGGRRFPPLRIRKTEAAAGRPEKGTEMEKKKDLRIGIMGTGKISMSFAEAAAATDGVCVTALFSRDAARGEEFATRIGGHLRVFTDEEAFYAGPVDAVYIATPNLLHAPAATRAIAHGLHVLVEKPAALDRQLFDRMCEAADRAGVVLMEAMRPLHDPLLARLRQLLPAVGRVRSVVMEYCQYSSRYDAFRRGEVLNAFCPALGNAAVMDIGVYCAAVLCALFGEPKQIRAASVFLRNGFEGAGQALLSYPGFTAALHYSKITESVTPSVILGEEGAVTADRLNAPTVVRLLSRTGEERQVFRAPEVWNNMVYEIRDFRDLIAAGKVRHPFRILTRRTLAVLDAIRAEAGIRFRP